MVKKQVAQDEIQEFIESQKIFVIKDQERVLRENEAIKAFIAKKEAWTEEQNKIQAVLKVKKHEFNMLCFRKFYQPRHFYTICGRLW